MIIDNVIGYLGPVAPVAILLFRNVYGWVHEAAKDGKFEPYEIRMLAKNLISLGSLSLLLTIGMPSLNGVDSTAIVASLDAIRNDLIGPFFEKKT